MNAIKATQLGKDFAPTKQPEPTDARPGSEAKLKVLQRRLLAGEELHHLDDMAIRAEPFEWTQPTK